MPTFAEAVAPSSLTSSLPGRIDTLARVAVSSGLGLRPGQQLVISAPVEAIDLVRRITAYAYQAGASMVTTLYSDDETTLARYRHASEESFD